MLRARRREFIWRAPRVSPFCDPPSGKAPGLYVRGVGGGAVLLSTAGRRSPRTPSAPPLLSAAVSRASTDFRERTVRSPDRAQKPRPWFRQSTRTASGDAARHTMHALRHVHLPAAAMRAAARAGRGDRDRAARGRAGMDMLERRVRAPGASPRSARAGVPGQQRIEMMQSRRRGDPRAAARAARHAEQAARIRQGTIAPRRSSASSSDARLRRRVLGAASSTARSCSRGERRRARQRGRGRSQSRPRPPNRSRPPPWRRSREPCSARANRRNSVDQTFETVISWRDAADGGGDVRLTPLHRPGGGATPPRRAPPRA